MSCGDVQLIFRNPGLNPDADGFIRASGNFFIQFQAVGAAADQITTFGFSFGPYGPGIGDVDESACDRPAWFTGGYVQNYRADTNPDDGFFINLQTTLVPDGQYIAAVHAYDANDNELARSWAKAIVDNCPDAAPQPEYCSGNNAKDIVVPWPIILPGDGALAEGTGFTVEFAEELDNVQVLLNGDDITTALASWEGRLWDNDQIPGYGPNGLATVLVPECSQQPPQKCDYLGEAYRWTGRALTTDDVIRVIATDTYGNVATKDIHLGSTVAGGAITQDAALVTMTVAQTAKTITAGSGAEFAFTLQNTGGGQGHVNPTAVGPEGWTVRWEQPHYVVDSGQTIETYVIVDPPANAASGGYQVNATLDYVGEGGTTKVLHQALMIQIEDASAGGVQGAGQGPTGAGGDNAATDSADGAGEESPGPALGAVALLFLGAAFASRRRA